MGLQHSFQQHSTVLGWEGFEGILRVRNSFHPRGIEGLGLIDTDKQKGTIRLDKGIADKDWTYSSPYWFRVYSIWCKWRTIYQNQTMKQPCKSQDVIIPYIEPSSHNSSYHYKLGILETTPIIQQPLHPYHNP